MKILQVTNKVPYPPKDGGTVAVLNMGKGLAEQRHEVHLFAINTSRHYVPRSQLNGALSYYSSIRTAYLNTDISASDAAKNLFLSRLPYNYERFYGYSVNGALRKFLLDEQFDVVLLEGLFLLPYLPEIRQNTNALVLYRAHNIEHEIWKRASAGEQNLPKRLYFSIMARRLKRIERKLVNQYDALLPITHRDQDVFNKLGNSKPAYVCPAGISSGQFQAYNTQKNQGDVFYLGALDWFPNQEALTWFVRKIWPQFYSKYPDTNLFVGGRNSPAWMERFLNKPGIKYYGEVNDAIDFMTRRKIMIVPLFAGSGMRIKIVEGMAAGRAIIATSIATEGIPVTPGKELLIADDQDAFQQALEQLINDKELRLQLGKQAQAFVKKHFENSTIAANLGEFLNQLAE